MLFVWQNFTYGNPQALEFFSPGYPRQEDIQPIVKEE
jgi:hypothetical protein